MTAVFHGRKKEEIGAGKVSSLLNIRLGKKGYSERWFALGMTAGFVQLEIFFTGRSAEAGLDLTLSVSQSVSYQNPNEPFRDF